MAGNVKKFMNLFNFKNEKICIYQKQENPNKSLSNDQDSNFFIIFQICLGMKMRLNCVKSYSFQGLEYSKRL